MVPKRFLIIAGAGAASLLIAGAAVAAFLSMAATAPSSFTAASIGDVSVGDAATVALFDVSDMEPGNSSSACFTATVDNTAELTPGDWRIYAGLTGGTGLQDYLQITIDLSDVGTGVASAGIFDCLAFHPASTVVAGQQLSLYASSADTYANADSLGVQTASAMNWVQIRITMTLPDTAAVQSGAEGLTASTSWRIENQ